MSYRVEELVSDTGRCKVWRSWAPMMSFSRDKAVTEASKLRRKTWKGGLWRKIRIRRNRTIPKPQEGNTK